MTFTPKLGLDYVQAAQAQKHVTMNEALSKVDVLVQANVIDKDLGSPPASPSEGDTYLLAYGQSGDWATHENDIATYLNGVWQFHTPSAGWRVYVVDENVPYDFDGTTWSIKSITADALADGSLLELGVNTGATSTNRLSVKSNNILFSHDDMTPGTGDMNVTMNKSAVADDASITYQTGFSGRVVVGLLANDDYTVRVSPDGSAFTNAFVVDKDTAKTDFNIVPSVSGDDVWHSGNDGAGSGLDADLLDGQHASEFAQLTGATFTGGVGINGGTPDATNKFVFSGTNALFRSSASIDTTFNKNAAANDASFSFKTAFSSKAIIGLLGNDDFTLKVGASATTAIVVAESSGAVEHTQHPKFSGYCNYDQYNAANAWFTIDINNTRHNDQSSISSGTFTAPHDGYYSFGAGYQFLLNATAPTEIRVGFAVNGAAPTSDRYVSTFDGGWIGSGSYVNATAVLKLSSGDTVEAEAYFATNDGYIDADKNYFHGHQVA